MKFNKEFSNKLYWKIRTRLFALYFFPKIIIQFFAFKLNRSPRFSLKLWDLKPCLYDATANTGFDRHYVFHTAWASRVVSTLSPKFHIDISSSLYFIVNVSAFIPVKFYDYRPANLVLPGLECYQGDVCSLSFPDSSVDSISCMHVVEHIGLGRYGDTLNFNGDLNAIEELKRVVKPGGALLFVVPVGGKALIKFNAHRIYTYQQVLGMFNGFYLKEFSYIPDSDKDGGLVINADPNLTLSQTYGCGCFWFEKENNL